VREAVTKEGRGQLLSFESLNNPYDILPAYWTLCHLLATLCAGTHVTTLQHHTVNWRVHADLAQGFIVHGLYVAFIPLLLLPQSLHNLQKFVFFYTAFKVYPTKAMEHDRFECITMLPIHCHELLDLLGA